MQGLRPRAATVDGFVAISPAMIELLGQATRYVRAETPLILVGPSGTGRRTLGALIHDCSGRLGPFRWCAARHFPPGHEWGVLFGEERATFSGLSIHRRGLFEDSADGTLLLGDFDAFSPDIQHLVLDAANRRAFRPFGADRDLALRSRLILTLREAPDRLVERGVLSENLRFELGCSILHLPVLDARREDIPALAHLFLERNPTETGVLGPRRFDPGALEVLTLASWPGNLLQLRMVIREAYLRACDAATVRAEHLAGLVHLTLRFERHGDPVANGRAVGLALQLADGRVRVAAGLLQTAPSTILRYQRGGCVFDAPARTNQSNAFVPPRA